MSDKRQRFQNGSAEPTPSASPEAYGKLIRSELKKWADVAKAAGIKKE